MNLRRRVDEARWFFATGSKDGVFWRQNRVIRPITQPSLLMKNYLLRSCLFLTGFALATPLIAQVNRDAGYVDLGKFTAAAGCEYVEVNLKSGLLKFTAAIVAKEEPEAAELLRNLKLVRVNVVGINDSNRRETVAHVTALRAELEKLGWEKVVTVLDSTGEKGDDVAIYMKSDGDESIAGLVVTVLGKNSEAVVVNVVGNIRADQIAKLGEKLDLKPLRDLKPLTQS